MIRHRLPGPSGRSIRGSALVLLLTASGCGVGTGPTVSSPSALLGIWDVTSFVVGDAGCRTGAPEDWVAPVFEVAQVEGSDSPLLLVFPCASADECDGETALDAVYAFDDFDLVSGRGVWESASFGGGTCFLTWHEDAISDVEDGGVEILQTRYEVGGLPGVDQADCERQQENWTGERTCARTESLQGR